MLRSFVRFVAQLVLLAVMAHAVIRACCFVAGLHGCTAGSVRGPAALAVLTTDQYG